MKQNVGKIDRIVRVVAGLGLLSLLFILDGNARWIGLLGAFPLASAITGVCCLYMPFGINTCYCKKDGETDEKKACCGGGSCGTDKAD
jgi:hypothetical protein